MVMVVGLMVVGRMVVGQGVRRGGVVGDVGDGHGRGGGGDGDGVVEDGLDGGRVDGRGQVVAAVVGDDHVVVGRVVRHGRGDDRERGGRGLDRVDDGVG